MEETTSFLQARRAYEQYTGHKIRANMTYQEAADYLIAEMGLKSAKKFIQSQSNDPKLVEDWKVS